MLMRKEVGPNAPDIGHRWIALLGRPILKNSMLMLFHLFAIVLLKVTTIVWWTWFNIKYFARDVLILSVNLLQLLLALYLIASHFS